MANLTPAIDYFDNECDIGFTVSGGGNITQGDKFLFADMAAALADAGYGWTKMYSVLTATYATDADAFMAFVDWDSASQYVIEKDAIVFGSDYATPQAGTVYLECGSSLEVLRETPRLAYFKLRNPREEENEAASNDDAHISLQALGAALSDKCELKALLSATYPTIAAIATALGDAGMTVGVGFGAAPNLQPEYETIDGNTFCSIRLDAYSGATGYGYLLLDLGHSISR
jgi:hypothetical protein